MLATFMKQVELSTCCPLYLTYEGAISMETKVCSKCKEEKSINEFNKRKDGKNNIRYICKLCQKKYKKKWDEKNTDKKRKYQKEYQILFAKYIVYFRQLTVDEEPRLAKDGISLEVKCKYCGKYFRPTNSETANRIKAINRKQTDFSERSLYCSEGCKYSCSTYGQILYPKDFKPATSREVQPQLRKLVLERDNWTCRKCGNKDCLHCHHIDPVANNPIESADVDNCITYCVECHKEAHQQDGCGYKETNIC